MANSTEVLDATAVAYYVPVLILSINIVLKHGVTQEAGWIFISLFALSQAISGATGIALQFEHKQGLVVAFVITSSVGAAALVALLTGVVNRINTNTERQVLSPRCTQWLQLLSLAATIFGIVGDVNQIDDNPDNKARGSVYMQFASIFLLLQCIASSSIAIASMMHISSVKSSDRKLLFLSLSSLPFHFVRCVWSITAAFNPGSQIFSLTAPDNTAVIIRAVMVVLTESIIVALFLIGGFVSPRQEKVVRADDSSVHVVQHVPLRTTTEEALVFANEIRVT